MSFWFIYIIFVPLGFIFGRSPIDVYKSNIFFLIFDFLGLSYFFHTPLFNDTWWFMNLIIIYYLLFPFIIRITKWSSEIMLLIATIISLAPMLFITGSIIKEWFLPFVLGIYFSNNEVFTTMQIRINTIYKRITVCVLLIVFFYLLDIQAVTAFAYILVSFFLLSRIPLLSNVLEHLGKHSGAIFMFHTFIFSLYFKDFIYWFKYPPIIFLVLTVLCYVVAVGLEYLKKLIRYDKLVKKVTQ